MKNATIITATFAALLTTGMMSGNAAAYEATTCKNITFTGSGSSAGGIAKFRKNRAERRAKKNWEKQAYNALGSKFDDFDDATVIYYNWSQTSRGNPQYTVTASIRACF